MRVAFLTHGCRLNQSESDALASDFADAGHDVGPAAAGADLIIVNTCTVTQAADREGRRLVRRLTRSLGPGRVVVTGCSAQRDPEAYAAIDGVRLVAGNDEKRRLVDLVAAGEDRSAVAPPPDRPSERLARLRARGRSSHARAYLRVQDGCNQACTFCTLPSVRGRSASVPLAMVREEAAALAAAGHRELVFTGAHLGSYGLDLSPRVSLPELIETVLTAAPAARVRLSSLEPRSVTPALIALLAGEPRLCPHLHLPLQSGDDGVLSRMRRAYRSDAYSRRALAAAGAVAERYGAGAPGLALGSDFLVGFPGEDDSAFAATLDLVERLPFTYGHVFTYSDRPGTPAASMPDRVPPSVARQRRDELVAALDRKGDVYRRAHLGHEVEVVVERVDASGGWRGTSERFVPVVLAGAAWSRGARALARVVGHESGSLQAIVLETSTSPAGAASPDDRPDREPGAPRAKSVPAAERRAQSTRTNRIVLVSPRAFSRMK